MRNKFLTGSEGETHLLGYYIACRFKGIKTFLLVGDLGVGKTVFVRGFCSFYGIEYIRSPSFLVINRYNGINHADLYRIDSWEDIYTSGIMEILDREILLVEWGEKLLPFIKGIPYILIRFKSINENTREITVDRVPS
ncbi:MAG: tRNA (adenosine(37)-N6)-threonylcarbamoyltransferase complex ATPase subunit type 1 TsaE [candidate division WOR-3 bacterium]